MNKWQAVEAAISAATGEPFSVIRESSVGGGCINRSFQLSDGKRDFFIKLNSAHLLDMFEAEYAALEEMFASNSIRVPHPVAVGESDADSWLVMEYISFGGSGSQSAAGEQLAALHRVTAEQFGWKRDNTIGSTPQVNDLSESWIDFWREHRLGYQLELAARNGYGGALQERGERLMEGFDQLIDHDLQASLLHGDLWGGNISYDGSGEPVIYDPALYYGDREADIAMTELFGGFGADFYSAYNAVWPLDAGYQVRKNLYNLYHILNHLNLFGSGYAAQAQGLIDRLLAETG